MTFQDLLTYEENCVKEGLALPHLNVCILTRDTYSDCETCGAYSSTVYEITGDLGELISGSYAGCLSSSEDGSLYEVAQWLNTQLQERKRPFPEILTHHAKEAAEEAYYVQAEICKWDYNHPSLESLGHTSSLLDKAFDSYYTTENLVRLYAAFGVTVDTEYEQDPIYDANDWEDDNYDENEEEECQED